MGYEEEGWGIGIAHCGLGVGRREQAQVAVERVACVEGQKNRWFDYKYYLGQGSSSIRQDRTLRRRRGLHTGEDKLSRARRVRFPL